MLDHGSLRILPLFLLVIAALCGCGQEDGGPDEFQIESGFELTLVAREPDVVDPVSMSFDEQGRLFVVEMIEYPEGSGDPGNPRSRVSVLVDSNRDGSFDTHRVFVDDLRYPTSALPWRDGVLIAAPPKLLFARDEDGDLRADSVEAVFDGFAVGNTQHNYNSLVLGMDGWIYAAGGGNPGEAAPTEGPGPSAAVGRKDVRFRPDTREIEIYGASSGGFGLTFDEWGRAFTTHNTVHVYHSVMPERYLARNPELHAASTLQSISDHGRSSRIFPISTAETRFNHPEQAGYFSGSSGITYYGGGAFPGGYENVLFVADVVTNLVHVDRIAPSGSGFTAQRLAQEREFLAGANNWFRPVNFTVGPEGALYVADMRRKVIEHPEYIPPSVREGLDLRAGDEAGRIYRIAPSGGLEAPSRMPGELSDDELIEALGHRNQWWRMTAQRLLVDRGGSAVRETIERRLHLEDSPLWRVHALWTLTQLGGLSDESLSAALEDSHSGVRENALKIAEQRAKKSSDLHKLMLQRADDPDPRTRFQAALTLGELGPAALPALLKVAARDASDPWVRLAIVSSATGAETRLAHTLASLEETPGRVELFKLLAETVGARAATGEIASLLSSARSPDSRWKTAILAGLADGLARSGRRPALSSNLVSQIAPLLVASAPDAKLAAWRLANLLEIPPSPGQERELRRAAETAADPNLEPDRRASALQMLEFASPEEHGDLVLDLVRAIHPPAVQNAALQVARAWDDGSVHQRLFFSWRQLSQPIRAGVLEASLTDSNKHEILISALEEETVKLGELNLTYSQRKRLLERSSRTVMERAAKLFSLHELSDRNDVVERRLDALDLAGDPIRGLSVFERVCEKCHAFQGRGGQTGPDLSHASSKSAETLLTDILDPNQAIVERYVTFVVSTADGRILDGRIVNDTEAAITLMNEHGEELVVPRRDVEEIRSSGLSLMPDGLEDELSSQDLADLISYLQQRER